MKVIGSVRIAANLSVRREMRKHLPACPKPRYALEQSAR